MKRKKRSMIIATAANIAAIFSLLLPIVEHSVKVGGIEILSTYISGLQLLFGVGNGLADWIMDFFMSSKLWYARIAFIFVPAGLIVISSALGAVFYKKRVGSICAIAGTALAMIEVLCFTFISKSSVCVGTIIFSFFCILALTFEIIGLVIQRQVENYFFASPLADGKQKKSDEKSIQGSHSLKGTEGTYAGAVFPLSDKKIIIGRDPEACNIVISSGKISRIHCTLWVDKDTDAVMIKDTSTNGVYYPNGERLLANKDIRIEQGSTIFIGNSSNGFQID